MAISNDERRQVAARLRSVADKGAPEWATSACCIAECLGEDNYPLWNGSEKLFDRLADLIEPEERICTFTDNWNDPDLPLPTCSACGWEAEETDCVCVIGGPMYQYDGKFCKECGAKVVEQ